MTRDCSWSFYYVWEKEIPEDLCDKFISSLNEENYIDGKINGTSDEIRNVDIKFNTSRWINAMLFGYMKYANSSNFNYEISDSDYEPLQFSRYESGKYYNNHIDFTLNPNTFSHTRKLSLSLQLSNEDDYVGGDLILAMPDGEVKISRKKGTIVVFDSRIIHRVTTVESGTRYSLVKWVHGDTPLR